VCLVVIASAAKQSILSLRGKMDCFAALAMTTRGVRKAKAGCDPIVGVGEALPPCGPAPDGHLCRWRWRLCADARRELRTEPAGDGGAVGTANRSRMPSPRILIQQPRLIGRIVVAQQLLQRRFIEPFFVRHVVRFQLKRRDARRIRLVCARIHVAFFRRRLTTKPPGPRPARSCETAGFGLPADRNSASMPRLECQGFMLRPGRDSSSV